MHSCKGASAQALLQRRYYTGTSAGGRPMVQQLSLPSSSPQPNPAHCHVAAQQCTPPPTSTSRLCIPQAHPPLEPPCLTQPSACTSSRRSAHRGRAHAVVAHTHAAQHPWAYTARTKKPWPHTHTWPHTWRWVGAHLAPHAHLAQHAHLALADHIDGNGHQLRGKAGTRACTGHRWERWQADVKHAHTCVCVNACMQVWHASKVRQDTGTLARC